MGIDHQKNAVHHLHDALDFAPEIGVARRVDDVDPITVPMESRVLRANRDSLLALEIHRVHHALLDLLIGAKGPRLPQQLIDQRRLAMVDVRNDRDITDFIHSRDVSSGGRSVNYRRRPEASQTSAARVVSRNAESPMTNDKEMTKPE